MLLRWSDVSLRNTTPRPCNAEPSRCMLHSVGHILEIAGVDGLQARLFDREPQQPSAGGNDRCRCLRANVSFGEQANAVRPDLLDRLHARNLGQTLLERLA